MQRVLLACLLLSACQQRAENFAAAGDVSEDLSAVANLTMADGAPAGNAEPVAYGAVPVFDARRACDFIASYMPDAEPHNVDPQCYADELAAKKALLKMRFSANTASYCQQLASALGPPGYSKFKKCVDDQLANEAALSQIEGDSGS